MRTKSKVIAEKPPANLEEVKRRFTRQNRELARNNSSQSLRIRSLDIEVSRLLADNLNLRNQALQLQNELKTTEMRAHDAAVRKVKQELQARFADLAAFINDIREDGGSTVRSLEGKKPIEGNYRERQTLTELMRDSQMPTIVEDKLFPRETLGAAEIQSIRSPELKNHESPELGPPPVAHFDEEDSAKNVSPPNSKTSPTSRTEEEDTLPANFSINLETRRKKRDSQPRLQTRRQSLLPPATITDEHEGSSVLRAGAKRKLSDREGDRPVKPSSKGDFIFSRRAAAIASDKLSATAGAVVPEPAVSSIDHSSGPTPGHSTRKILGEKSVNQSPRKGAITAQNFEKQGPIKPARSRAPSRQDSASVNKESISFRRPAGQRDEIINSIEVVPDQHEATSERLLETPAPCDFFSPTPSETSAKAEGRGDTPPPGSLSAASTTTESTHRPSRRARAAVNYAEPSLISKMRRPDKKLVDAVSGLQDPRRAVSASAEGKKDSSQAVTIKQEALDENQNGIGYGSHASWKLLPSSQDIHPSSPLEWKGEAHQTFLPPADLAVKDDRDMSISTTRAAVLFVDTRKRSLSIQQPVGSDTEVATRKLGDLDIYDFKESSSPSTDANPGNTSKMVTSSAPRSHRRHSSVPKSIVGMEVSIPSSEAAIQPGKSERAAIRRRSMML